MPWGKRSGLLSTFTVSTVPASLTSNSMTAAADEPVPLGIVLGSCGRTSVGGATSESSALYTFVSGVTGSATRGAGGAGISGCRGNGDGAAAGDGLTEVSSFALAGP